MSLSKSATALPSLCMRSEVAISPSLRMTAARQRMIALTRAFARLRRRTASSARASLHSIPTSMCTSLVSALTKKPVFRDIAMTGEITLRGRVLAIGGIKEKILAAHRGGIKKVVIPKENENDLKDIPATVLKTVEIVSVEHMDEVLSHAFILEPGDTLFKENDIPFEVMADEMDKDQRSALI